MSDAYLVSYSLNAREDLEDIARYISQTLGLRKAALQRLRTIRDAIRSLERMPLRHPLVEDDALPQRDYRRMNVGNYAIYYVVDEDAHEVLIVRIAGARRELRRILGSS